jgi:hypothetical protein
VLGAIGQSGTNGGAVPLGEQGLAVAEVEPEAKGVRAAALQAVARQARVQGSGLHARLAGGGGPLTRPLH